MLGTTGTRSSSSSPHLFLSCSLHSSSSASCALPSFFNELLLPLSRFLHLLFLHYETHFLALLRCCSWFPSCVLSPRFNRPSDSICCRLLLFIVQSRQLRRGLYPSFHVAFISFRQVRDDLPRPFGFLKVSDHCFLHILTTQQTLDDVLLIVLPLISLGFLVSLDSWLVFSEIGSSCFCVFLHRTS